MGYILLLYSIQMNGLLMGKTLLLTFCIEAFAGISNAENRNTRCKFDLRDVIEALDSYGKTISLYLLS